MSEAIVPFLGSNDAMKIRGQFIVLVGIDGSGKSSVLSQLRTANVVVTDWRDLRNHELPQMLAPDAPTQIKQRLSPLARSMFIGGHVVAQYEYLVRPRIDDGHHVLLDSYYFKLLAKERLLGKLHPAFEEVCADLPVPDCVIFLDTDPEVSFSRKRGAISPYEYFTSPTQTDYVSFQRQLRALILGQVQATGCFHVVDGNGALDATLRQVASIMQRTLRPVAMQVAE